MNKYLKEHNKILDSFKDNDDNCGNYEYLAKCMIAEEFDCYFGGYYDDDRYKELTDEQEEYLIQIIYDYYIDTEDMNYFRATKGVVDTFVNYNSFEEFKKDYENEEKYVEIMDNINWSATSY